MENEGQTQFSPIFSLKIEEDWADYDIPQLEAISWGKSRMSLILPDTTWKICFHEIIFQNSISIFMENNVRVLDSSRPWLLLG